VQGFWEEEGKEKDVQNAEGLPLIEAEGGRTTAVDHRL